MQAPSDTDYSRESRPRGLVPLVVVCAEGDSEERHVGEVLKPFGVSVKFGRQASLGRQLVDNVLEAHAKHTKDSSKERPVVPVVVCDLEIVSEQTAALARDVVEYGKRNGVAVFINTPHLERRILQHFAPCPETETKSQINRRLAHETAKAGFPPYVKPGSVAFHRRLARLTPTADKNCQASGHSSLGLPCLCELFALVRTVQAA